MAWDRLDQTSTEVIEDALFKLFDAFPIIMNQDYAKLTKLSDLLMALQSGTFSWKETCLVLHT